MYKRQPQGYNGSASKLTKKCRFRQFVTTSCYTQTVSGVCHLSGPRYQYIEQHDLLLRVERRTAEERDVSATYVKAWNFAGGHERCEVRCASSKL